MITNDTVVHLDEVRIRRLTDDQLVNTIIDTLALLAEGTMPEARDREGRYLERLFAVAEQRHLTIPTA